MYSNTLSFETFKDLSENIVPTAVFVAVMALQLKYFRPHRDDDRRDQYRELGPAEHRHLSFVGMSDQPSLIERSKTQETDNNTLVQDATDLTGASPRGAVKKRHVQNFVEKYWTYFTKTFNLINEFFWRLLEIYLPKAIIFIIFAALLDEISATHFLVLAILIVAIPVNVNPVMYLILTGIISILAVLKMLYQVALVDKNLFNFTNSCPVRNCIYHTHLEIIAYIIINQKFH